MKQYKSFKYSVWVLTFVFFYALNSCKILTSEKIIGCYQHLLIFEGAFVYEDGKYYNLYGTTVLHPNYTYSSFASKKNDCESYNKDKEYVSGTWYRRGRYLHLNSFVQDSSKVWINTVYKTEFRSKDSLMVCVHRSSTKEVDSDCKKIIVSSVGNDALSDTYCSENGIFYINKKNLFSKKGIIINGFDRYHSLKIQLSDSLISRLDLYLLPLDKMQNQKYRILPNYLEKRTFYWHGIIPKIVSFKMYKVM